MGYNQPLPWGILTHEAEKLPEWTPPQASEISIIRVGKPSRSGTAAGRLLCSSKNKYTSSSEFCKTLQPHKE